MKNLNKLDEVPIAHIDENAIHKIKQLEKELGSKYYIIAFDKQGQDTHLDDQSRQYVFYE